MRRHVEGILWLAALLSFMLAGITSTKTSVILLGVLGLGATVVVVPLHFFRAWSGLGSAPNKREYCLCVSFETLCVLGLALALGWALLQNDGSRTRRPQRLKPCPCPTETNQPAARRRVPSPAVKFPLS